MPNATWSNRGPDFGLDWAGRSWTLRLDHPTPGLYADGVGPILGLDGVAAIGRFDPSALSGATLAGFACRFDRVEATYAPPDWGEMTVKATWSRAAHDDAMDLLIELVAHSVDELKVVEVLILSHPSQADGSSSVPSVQPRGASLGIPDEPRLGSIPETRPEGLSPGRDPRPSWIAGKPDARHGTYIDLAHPDDVSRRMADPDGCWIRNALFGYDLERGVVLRGRLRGLWCVGSDAGRVAGAALDRFLAEPLPLTT